ncbi:serine/threonine protein kinase [Thermoleophilia bacterium SCSIO 60948]|nr:serine/threonine protein kinase [Thermoleophilia bacterium SCSIO 60948]
MSPAALETAPVRGPLEPGRLLAPGLEVTEHLSRGEALDVYAAFDHGRWCPVIAKTPTPERARDDATAARLRTEGRLLATLAHPHLARAYETLDAPRLIVVMETLPGRTLSALLDDEPDGIGAEDLALLGSQIGSAVRYLHRHGYLHLDLKPSNVIVEAGIARVFDLSIARRPGPARRGLGSLDYMSPEQARGGELGPAADVWGLGIVLHEAATGALPFGERDGDEVGQLAERAPLLSETTSLPPAPAAIIDACLEPDPAARPALDEVLTSLRASRDGGHLA